MKFSPSPLKKFEKEYINENHKALSVLRMAKNISRGTEIIRKHMLDMGLKEFIPSRAVPLSYLEKLYINSMHSFTTVLKMRVHLKRCTAVIYEYMQENNLPVFREKGSVKELTQRSEAKLYIQQPQQEEQEEQETVFFNVDARKGEYTWLV